MNVVVIIRTCQRDDYLAYMCYLSARHVFRQYNISFVFFMEQGIYNWVDPEKYEPNVTLITRRSCDNFGGEQGVHTCLQLKKIKLPDYIDYVVFCDSDIVFTKNPLEYSFEFGGIQSATNERHFSGQCLIYSRWVWEAVLNYPDYETLINQFVKEGKDVADDTIMSWVATYYTSNVYGFGNGQCWIHEKLYQLNPYLYGT